MPTYKILLVGDPGVGKTAFVRRLQDDTFLKIYLASVGVKMTTIGPDSDDVVFEVWDSSIGVFRQGFHAAIVMFSVDNLNSYRSVSVWIRRIRELSGDIPIIVCANKVDERARIVTGLQVTQFQVPNVYPIETSVKTGYYLSRPLKLLTQGLAIRAALGLIAPIPKGTCAAARLEAARLEVANIEAIKRERATRRETAKQEAAKLTAAKLEADKREAAKLEAAKREIDKQEAAKREAAKLEADKLEADKQEAAKREAAKQESAKLTAAKLEAAKCEIAKQEAAKREADKLERAAKLEAAKRDRVVKRDKVALLIEKMNRATDMLMQAYRLGENDDHPALVDLNIAEAKKILKTLA